LECVFKAILLDNKSYGLKIEIKRLEDQIKNWKKDGVGSWIDSDQSGSVDPTAKAIR
jgi:hypothetical protein